MMDEYYGTEDQMEYYPLEEEVQFSPGLETMAPCHDESDDEDLSKRYKLEEEIVNIDFALMKKLANKERKLMMY